MSLLREIQDASISSTSPAVELLRRCKILAARLGSREFGDWVDRELNGYPDDAELPDYRISDVDSAGYFIGPLGSGVKNGPIPLSCIPERYRERMQYTRNRQPIGALEDLLAGKRTGTFSATWPADLVKLVSRDIYVNMSCVSAWQIIPRGSVVAVVDAVRSRVLSFVLEIESVAPDAGETPPGKSGVSPDQVHQVFLTNIYGGTVGNLSTGGHTVSQSAGAVIGCGDWSSLSFELKAMGFDEKEIEDLKTAVAEDRVLGHAGMGTKVSKWLGAALKKAGEGVLKVGIETAAAKLPGIIASFIGSTAV